MFGFALRKGEDPIGKSRENSSYFARSSGVGYGAARQLTETYSSPATSYARTPRCRGSTTSPSTAAASTSSSGGSLSPGGEPPWVNDLVPLGECRHHKLLLFCGPPVSVRVLRLDELLETAASRYPALATLNAQSECSHRARHISRDRAGWLHNSSVGTEKIVFKEAQAGKIEGRPRAERERIAAMLLRPSLSVLRGQNCHCDIIVVRGISAVTLLYVNGRPQRGHGARGHRSAVAAGEFVRGDPWVVGGQNLNASPDQICSIRSQKLG